MKKLIMLISFLILGLTVFSQTDTTNQVKTFPIPIVKFIMKDLISGDLAKLQLRLTEDLLIKTEEKVSLKDSFINVMRIKEVNYQTIIESEKQKYSLMDNYSKKLEWDLKKQRVSNKFKSIVGTSTVLLLTFFLITK